MSNRIVVCQILCYKAWKPSWVITIHPDISGSLLPAFGSNMPRYVKASTTSTSFPGVWIYSGGSSTQTACVLVQLISRSKQNLPFKLIVIDYKVSYCKPAFASQLFLARAMDKQDSVKSFLSSSVISMQLSQDGDDNCTVRLLSGFRCHELVNLIGKLYDYCDNKATSISISDVDAHSCRMSTGNAHWLENVCWKGSPHCIVRLG